MTNPVIQSIKERRSIRNFEQKEIDKEILRGIIQTGKYAPSPMNRQPWKFIVITNRDFIQDLSLQVKEELKNLLRKRFIKKFSIKDLKDKELVRLIYAFSFSDKDIIFFDAPALVFIVTKENLFFDESCACCAENMMLAAHSLGIGSCWIGFASVLGLKKKILHKIGVPDKHHISAAIVFGYPKEKPGRASIRKIGSDIIKWIE